MRMEATAFARDSKPTASGTVAHEGIVAADPAVLPFGSRIRVRGANAFDGIYTVTDTGPKIVGRHIDLCLPNAEQAKQFGKKVVTVQVLTRGTGKEDARAKDIPAPAKIR
jgi:3D (Asp-Asp-Asp) domain-containing protein